MIRRPPRSTLFPTRRSSDLRTSSINALRSPVKAGLAAPFRTFDACTRSSFNAERQRSEEHTSELQSRRDLVCRLLLEKKNTNCINHNILSDITDTKDLF